jgi:hypothetical protein
MYRPFILQLGSGISLISAMNSPPILTGVENIIAATSSTSVFVSPLFDA